MTNYPLNYPLSQNKIFPEIDLGNFYLREKRESDVADFFAYYSDPEVSKFILCEIPRDLEEGRRELNYWRNVFYQNDGIYFAIADKKNDRLIGSIGLTGFNSYQARIEISYDLNKEYWNRGIMTAAIKAVTKYAFENFCYGWVNRIEAFTSSSNIPSQNLLVKCGFVFEGILRQHRFHRGQYVDVYSYSFVRSDFSSQNKESYLLKD
jgi:[ribosomal protein S5]-alanine N-acetyltransferase